MSDQIPFLDPFQSIVSFNFGSADFLTFSYVGGVQGGGPPSGVNMEVDFPQFAGGTPGLKLMDGGVPINGAILALGGTHVITAKEPTAELQGSAGLAMQGFALETFNGNFDVGGVIFLNLRQLASQGGRSSSAPFQMIMRNTTNGASGFFGGFQTGFYTAKKKLIASGKSIKCSPSDILYTPTPDTLGPSVSVVAGGPTKTLTVTVNPAKLTFTPPS